MSRTLYIIAPLMQCFRAACICLAAAWLQIHGTILILSYTAHVSVQIHMKADAMPQTVLSIATVKLAREMLRREDCYEGAHLMLILPYALGIFIMDLDIW